MKNRYSLIACFIIGVTLVSYRVVYSGISSPVPLKVTTWDALGYYMYLPSVFQYHDFRKLEWEPRIDSTYHLTGGAFYQAERQKDGNYAFKYLGGVAVLQLPFYLVAHLLAGHLGYPPDGFSPPYQYALGFGVILYCILGLLLLRVVLLRYYSDTATAVTLLMVCLATNFIQYAAIDNGQSHAYIFPLYAAVLYATIKWHSRPSSWVAIVLGYIIGLAAICRPTEAIMLFIPLFWNTQNKAASAAKWQLVRHHKRHMWLAAAGGLLGVLPQLLYWKAATGSFIYDVGSKWDFLNPHFRVLLGWEKGWFIYTPVTILFVAGMFFIRNMPFRKSVLIFCLTNIYIIIAWHDWRYGGSYATRALVQSYPVFALPFAALTQYIMRNKFKFVAYGILLYLLFVNLFQIYQYNRTILHYNDMNRAYYAGIYLNPHPTPADMSRLDNNEVPGSMRSYSKKIIYQSYSPLSLTAAGDSVTVASIPYTKPVNGDVWLQIIAQIHAPGNLWNSYLGISTSIGGVVSNHYTRLFSPLSQDTATNEYEFFSHVNSAGAGKVYIFIKSSAGFHGTIKGLTITQLQR